MGTFCLIGMISLQLTIQNGEMALPATFAKLYNGQVSLVGDANAPDALVMSGYSIKNAPTSSGVTILTLPYPTSGYHSQLCICVEDANQTQAWIRNCKRGIWTNWRSL